MKLSILVPAFNEAPTVGRLLDRVATAPFSRGIDAVEIVVVDDGSTDGTTDAVRAWRPPADGFAGLAATVHVQPENRGKGAAIRKAMELASGDICLIQDADLEYDPADYPVLLGPLLAGQADVVFGSRFLAGPHRVLFFWHQQGNRLLTLCSNALTDLNLTDMETGYKAFTIDVARRLKLRSERFGFEPEFTAHVAQMGARIYEVPVSYHGRSYAEGKKIGWKDGIEAMWCIVRCNIEARREHRLGQR
jgi:glycosyltransferase involved in cell wall biosynthesis